MDSSAWSGTVPLLAAARCEPPALMDGGQAVVIGVVFPSRAMYTAHAKSLLASQRCEYQQSTNHSPCQPMLAGTVMHQCTLGHHVNDRADASLLTDFLLAATPRAE
ncbi:hypothetical protein L917_05227 [Phytophthora nicotianae]|uniref:Uncharacterized protein n=1 Tax=Phytophthora nicotianae TaxID=4792 RepID=W2NPX8_PHYNI|nr:hypothetical protein L916_05345 [Phytophthora nicotianae]ETL97522.1 hypothetical protein L917_05227 [Phytophthora nicotianae]ETM50682.1 hypothetical protein L914_05342 [Phytophthora nicotianae]